MLTVPPKARWNIASLALPTAGVVLWLSECGYFAPAELLLFACCLGALCAIISLVRRERWKGLSLIGLVLNILVWLSWTWESSRHFKLG
jgi:hypothetical protein